MAAISAEGELFTWSLIVGGGGHDSLAGLGHGAAQVINSLTQLVIHQKFKIFTKLLLTITRDGRARPRCGAGNHHRAALISSPQHDPLKILEEDEEDRESRGPFGRGRQQVGLSER